ncbi:VWA domain-containing protein, partial [Corallococcus sp. 4LFB]
DGEPSVGPTALGEFKVLGSGARLRRGVARAGLGGTTVPKSWSPHRPIRHGLHARGRRGGLPLAVGALGAELFGEVV